MLRYLFSICLLASASSQSSEWINFDHFALGPLPKGWTTGVTGKGSEYWSVVSDPTAPSSPNVLKQSGQGLFLWAVRDGVSIADGWAEVKFKPISGEGDQAGGILFRFKDANNYYIARANAQEQNVTFYRMIEGRRRSFQSIRADVATKVWHSLRVDFNGSHFSMSYEGKKILEAEDEKIKGPGKVGLWTKNDSVALFDDFGFGEAHVP